MPLYHFNWSGCSLDGYRIDDCSSAATLTADHLTAINVDPATPVIGTEGGREFTRVLIGNERTMDVAAAEQ
ncbi:MAG: hypothetical protein ACJ8CX_03705, partial [Microvirga sp.]